MGTYEYVGGEKDVDALDEAIDETVAEMSIFVRGIARRRLRKPNLPSEQVQISVDDDVIVIDRPGQPKVAAPVNGKPVAWTHPENGNEFRVRHRLDDQCLLHQIFEGDRSTSKNRFILGDDGQSLTVETVITSGRLPADLRFEMHYREKESP